MRGRDKPFVMYRRGPANFIIVPRGMLGWTQFAVWLALLGALVVWFADQFLLNSGIWWMIARAEIVEVAELMRDRQRARRKRRRGQ